MSKDGAPKDQNDKKKEPIDTIPLTDFIHMVEKLEQEETTSVDNSKESTTLEDFSKCLTLQGDATYRPGEDKTIDGLIIVDQRYDETPSNFAPSSSSSSSSGTKVNNDEGKMDQKDT